MSKTIKRYKLRPWVVDLLCDFVELVLMAGMVALIVALYLIVY